MQASLLLALHSNSLPNWDWKQGAKLGSKCRDRGYPAEVTDLNRARTAQGAWTGSGFEVIRDS